MEQQAVNLMSMLKRPTAPSETKVNLFNSLKSDIKHYRVPETAQSNIFDCIKLGITQQSSAALASSAFSTLGHLIKRLKIQDASGHAITQLSPRLFPAIHDRLGDLREPVRAAASQALIDLYPFCATEIEQLVCDEALPGTNPRAKETVMRWVVRMHQEENMPFKAYVSPMVARLADPDGAVQEAAKSVLIELFTDAPNGAKIDLKRQLKAHSIKHVIESSILTQIGSTAAAPRPAPAAAAGPSSAEDPDLDTEAVRAARAKAFAQAFTNSLNSEAAQPPPQEVVPMDPKYVQSLRELDDTFREMLPCFDGKEDEHNWQARDKSVTTVRCLLKGNAPTEFHHAFMSGVKSLLEGIIKTSSSLRTTMSSNGCQLVRELAVTLGPALDPHVEILLQSFIKMSAATKQIAAENGRSTTDHIFQNCTYHIRMMQHVWNAAQDKNIQVRQFVGDWLRTILKRQASYKQHFETSGSLDLAEKCIRKGLDDANPKVKENSRTTYWTFAKIWPEKADKIMASLEAKARAALEKDPHNPHASIHSSQTLAPPTARSSGASSRSTLREAIAEQRKAKAKQMERPNSAMADFTPAKMKSHSNLRNAARAPSNLSSVQSRNPSSSSTAADPAPGSGSAAKKGSALMSGPVRRPRRVEVQRPQTADPYASRRLLRPETPSIAGSPGSPSRSTGASKASIPTSSSTVRNRALGSPASSIARRSPIPTNHGHHYPDSRPSSKGSLTAQPDEDMTMVAPATSRFAATRGRDVPSPGQNRAGHAKTMSVDNGILAMAEDEGFTMVLPNIADSSTRQRSPLAYRSPMRAMFDDARERAERLSPEAQRAMDSAATRKSPSPAVVVHDHLNNNITHNGTSNGTPKNDEVQIYEDPFTDEEPASGDAAGRKVLGELPVNENVRLVSPTQSPISRPSPMDSPHRHSDRSDLPDDPTNTSASASHDQTEVLRNRRLIASGIERIRARTLDAHGFRRVQDLVKSPMDLWESGKKYDELMAVLHDYLQTFDRDAKLASLPPSKAAGLKAQALGAVRALLAIHRKYAHPWYSRTLLVLLACRATLPVNLNPISQSSPSANPPSDLTSSSPANSTASNNHHHYHLVISDLLRTADDIVAVAPPAPCLEAIQAWLPSSSSNSSKDSNGTSTSPRAIAMALTLLKNLLVASSSGKTSRPPTASSASTSTPPNNGGVEQGTASSLPADLLILLARSSARWLGASDAEVRKADVDLASELFEGWFAGGANGGGNFAGAGSLTPELFWREFRGVEESRLGLLTYYIAKRGKKAGTGTGNVAR
jgi:CLIP-associating protein 1/2